METVWNVILEHVNDMQYADGRTYVCTLYMLEHTSVGLALAHPINRQHHVTVA